MDDEYAKQREELRRKELVEANMKALRESLFPDEVAYYLRVLQGLDLTPAEKEELRKVLWERGGG